MSRKPNLQCQGRYPNHRYRGGEACERCGALRSGPWRTEDDPRTARLRELRRQPTRRPRPPDAPPTFADRLAERIAGDPADTGRAHGSEAPIA